MSVFFQSRAKKRGLPPGTPVYIGTDDHEITIAAHRLGIGSQLETIIAPGAPLPQPEAGTMLWIHADGVHSETLMKQFADDFTLHDLVVEDVVNTDHRPKVEQHPDYLFLVLRALSCSDSKQVAHEQISVIAGQQWVLTFGQRPNDIFQRLKERLSQQVAEEAAIDSSFFVCAILDSVVDEYFTVLEALNDTIDQLEDEVLELANQETLAKIQHLRHQILITRRTLWPMREVLAGLERRHSPSWTKLPAFHLRDVYDHIIYCSETLDVFREMSSGLLEIYLSGVSNRTNEIMKVLTIFSTIFLPLSFLAGIYGMNFLFMPELGWRWGYPAALAAMAAAAGTMICFFRRRRWF